MSDALNIHETIKLTYEKYKNVHEGELASYIPELSKANPDDFGIAVATVDGQVFSVGDWEREFTIQSICKPFAFQLALEEFGRGETLVRVGVEPSGDAFNSIELDPKTMRPFNPMVNAGAIAVASLIKKDSAAAGVQMFIEKMQLAAGRKLRIDGAVLASETTTGNRNRAIAYLMLNFGIISKYGDESRYGRAGVRLSVHQGRACRYVHLWSLRPRGRMGISGWSPRQKRSWRRPSRGRKSPIGDRRLFPSAGRQRQQCARNHGLQRIGRPTGVARV